MKYHWRCELFAYTGQFLDLPRNKPAPSMWYRFWAWLFFGQRWFKVYVDREGKPYE